MKKLLVLFVSTFFIFGLHAQNSALRLEPLSMSKKSKSEKYDLITKGGKPVGFFDKRSQKMLSFTGEEISNSKNVAKTKCSFITQKSTKEDVATITLHVIGDPWGNGTGVQMLLDEDAVMVDNFWDWYLGDESLFYSQSEYKIPENATYTYVNPQVILDGTGSVDIPEGTYDFLFLRPWSWAHMLCLLNWAGSSEYAMADDFTFLAGFEYIFTVESAGDIAFTTPEDIMLSNMILPQPSLDLTDNENVTVVIFNNGMENISGNILLVYKVNEGVETVETLTIPELEPNASIIYTFNAKADFSETGFFTVAARVEYEFDSNPYNNTISGQTKKMTLIDLPFTDEFDTPNSMQSWSTIDGNGDGLAWLYDNWFLTDADGGVGCLQVLCQTYGANEYLITDPIAIAEAGAYTMSFYSYRLGNDNIKILYGTTFNVDEMTLLDVVTPDDLEWGQITVDVEMEAPGNYFFAFHYTGNYAEGDRGVNFDKFSFKSNTNTYTITASSVGCAVIIPNGEVKVKEGESQTFQIVVPDDGCAVSAVLIDGVFNEEATETFTYTFNNVTANHTIEVLSVNSVSEFQYKLRVYPNPAKDVLFIEIEDANMYKIVVYNILGKTVHLAPSVNNSTYKLNTSDFLPGIYFIAIQTGSGETLSKFVVE